jgi:hypothetical protein
MLCLHRPQQPPCCLAMQPTMHKSDNFRSSGCTKTASQDAPATPARTCHTTMQTHSSRPLGCRHAPVLLTKHPWLVIRAPCKTWVLWCCSTSPPLPLRPSRMCPSVRPNQQPPARAPGGWGAQSRRPVPPFSTHTVTQPSSVVHLNAGGHTSMSPAPARSGCGVCAAKDCGAWAWRQPPPPHQQ